MHLEIRKIGKKKKYYLAHSFREGEKVHKIRRYLGVNLNKKQLNKLRKRAEEIIKQQIASYKIISDPLKQELSIGEINLVKSLRKKIKLKLTHLSEKDWQFFSELFTYHTNAIEGSTITQSEVIDILEKQRWPKEKSKEDISETYGVKEAIDFIRKSKSHLSLELIKKIHYIIFKNSKPFAGKFRPKGIEVHIRDGWGNIIHVGAPSSRIKSLLEELISWYNKNKNKYPPLILAVVVHNQFETVHPFQDGNGRVGRLLLNNILIKHKLPPVNIELKHRQEYYSALREYQTKGNIRPTIELIIKEYQELKKRLKG